MLENYEENNVFKVSVCCGVWQAIPYWFCIQIVNEDTKYVGHFLRVPYKDYPTAFEKDLEEASYDIEVDEMR